MNEETKNKLTAAIDKMLDVLTENDERGFRNQGERLAFYFQKLREKEQRWSSSKPCMFPGCTQPSIPRSHTIPRSASLKIIAEDGHVATPSFYKGDLRVEPVGLGVASVFPGFCEQHEQIFQSFEMGGRIATANDMALQGLRVVCREIRLKEEQHRFTKSLRDEHQELITARGLEELRNILGTEFLASHSISAINLIELDSVHATASQQLQRLEAELDEYRADFFDPLMNELQGKGDHVEVIAVTLPKQVPVCLAGRGNFRFQETGKEESRNVVAILNVWPRETETDIFMLVQKRDEDAAKTYFAKFSKPGFKLTALIESWMVHGTDHWFMKPSEWDRIPGARKEAILNDMLDVSCNIGNEYGGSIFDDLRQQAIKQNENDNRPEVKEWLEHERKKLAYP